LPDPRLAAMELEPCRDATKMCRRSAPQSPHRPPVAPSLDGTVSPEGAL
jgi:hypothetical protein